jgi:hypothetical protein
VAERKSGTSRRLLVAAGVVLFTWGTIHLLRHRPPLPPVVEEPARASTLEALGDLAEGVPLGPYVISGVSEPILGAVLVHASSPAGEVTYEVRLSSDTPLPAARAGRYDVYYRANDGGPNILAGAIALGERLQRVPADGPPIPGLTKYAVPPP